MSKYELEERTAVFSEKVIELCKVTRKDNINSPIVSQLIRSATSIGANYQEANAASSKKDFKNKIQISKKEAQETHYWLRLLLKSNPEQQKEIDQLRDEVTQFVLIFGKIISTINKSKLEF